MTINVMASLPIKNVPEESRRHCSPTGVAAELDFRGPR